MFRKSVLVNFLFYRGDQGIFFEKQKNQQQQSELNDP